MCTQISSPKTPPHLDADIYRWNSNIDTPCLATLVSQARNLSVLFFNFGPATLSTHQDQLYPTRSLQLR